MSKPILKVNTVFKNVVTVVEVKGGWTTVKDENGEIAKIRNGMLRDLTPDELAKHEAKDKAVKPTKPAKEPKAAKPAKAKRDPVTAQPETGDILNGDGSELVNTQRLVNPDYDRYVKHDVKSPSGRKALDIDDEAAKLLRGQDVSDCYFIVAKNLAKTNGGDPDKIETELCEKYQHLNVGMQRMNLGNRLRKAMGIYGNLNAHKGPSRPRTAKADHPTADDGQTVNYGRRAGETLKRATDPKPAA